MKPRLPLWAKALFFSVGFAGGLALSVLVGP